MNLHTLNIYNNDYISYKKIAKSNLCILILDKFHFENVYNNFKNLNLTDEILNDINFYKYDGVVEYTDQIYIGQPRYRDIYKYKN